jgi:nucleoside-diphosphate-sugar epimerase
MKVLVIGGAGFIGRRLIALLAKQGHEMTCFDINTSVNIPELSAPIIRGDVTQYDDVISAVAKVKPDRLLNLSYYIGSDMPPHLATKLNIIGIDNTFEAARLFGVKHTIYASSLAVCGEQRSYGDKMTDENSLKLGENQYAQHKIFNEFQAKDYTDKYGMVITAVRPVNVTGPDKYNGSVDHVEIITKPARGIAVKFPFRDTMRIPIHVDEIANVFAAITVVDKPKHSVYNSGGTPISMGDLGNLVKEFVPNADIKFDKDTGGLEKSRNYLIDNSRLLGEFGLKYVPFRTRVLQIINDVRKTEGLPPATDPKAA